MNKIIVLVFVVLSSLFFSIYKDNDKLQVHFLDVGQGDAILIRTPEGQNILIDGGEDNKLLSQLANVLPWWEREIDYLVITHYHADHMMGFIELLNKYKVKNILVSSHQVDDFLYNIWTEKLIKNNLKPTIVTAGEKFVVSEDLFWQILLADNYHEDYNENSVVIKLSYKNQDFLFTGDLGEEGEQKLLASNFNLEADYLKVGHHGSRYSSSEAFLRAVEPTICIIQSGIDNKHGHPHIEAIERLQNIGCEIKDTQDLGLISFTID
jgi:competence protein ComEC